MAAIEEVAVAVEEAGVVDAVVGEDVVAEAGDVAVDEVTVHRLSSWPTPCRCRGLQSSVLLPGSTTTTVADVAAVVAAAEVVAEAVDGVILPVAEEVKVVAASWHLPLTLALEVEVVSMVRLMSCVALAYWYSQRVFIDRWSCVLLVIGVLYVSYRALLYIYFCSHSFSN